MENYDTEKSCYGFLENEAVEKYFADLNIKLLSGRHIHNDEYNSYSVLEDHFDQLKYYYHTLYKLELVKDTADQSRYYYLDFYDDSRGKLSDPSRTRILTEQQTIIGLMLLNMYYAKYFDDPKNVKWSEIKREIQEGDRKESFQVFFFKTVRAEFTPTEWNEVERKFTKTILTFNELGWVKKISGQHEELLFEINPSIHRMAKLYSKELTDFDSFLALVKHKDGK
jgi:hypothetical protein